MGSLAERVVEAGLVTQQQADIARLEAVKINRSFWYALVELEYLSEENVIRFFAQEAQVSYVHLPDYRIKRTALEMLEEHFCRQNTVIPLCHIGDTLFIACNNPFNAALLDMAGKISGCVIEPVMATSTDIMQALDYHWHRPDINFEAADFLVRSEPLKGMMFWRGSERVSVDIAVHIAVKDDDFSLSLTSGIDARAHDISGDGSAIGVYIPLYLPAGVRVSAQFDHYDAGQGQNKSVECEGKVIHCFMHNTRKFTAGIRFGAAPAGIMQRILKRAITDTQGKDAWPIQ